MAPSEVEENREGGGITRPQLLEMTKAESLGIEEKIPNPFISSQLR